MRISIYIALVAAFSFASCNKMIEADKNAQTDEVSNVLSPELGHLVKMPMADHFDCTGQIDIPPSDKASLFAPIAGMVDDLKVIPGTKVYKGQKLATLEHLEIINIQQRYLTQVANFKVIEKEFQRKKDLYSREVISSSEYQTSESKFEIAKAEKQGSEAQLKLLGIVPASVEKNGVSSRIILRSPISGFVGEVNINTRMYIEANTEILTVLNPDHKHLELEIFAKDIEKVSQDQQVVFKVPGSTKEYHASILLLGQVVDENDRSISVHAHLLEDYPELVVGTRVSATLFGQPDSVYVLPESALVNNSGQRYALVEKGGNYEPIEIKVGRESNGYTEVLNYADLLKHRMVIENAYYFMQN